MYTKYGFHLKSQVRTQKWEKQTNCEQNTIILNCQLSQWAINTFLCSVFCTHIHTYYVLVHFSFLFMVYNVCYVHTRTSITHYVCKTFFVLFESFPCTFWLCSKFYYPWDITQQVRRADLYARSIRSLEIGCNYLCLVLRSWS